VRRLLLVTLLATSPVVLAESKADKSEKSEKSEKKADAPKPPRTPGPDDAEAVAILNKIVAGKSSAERKAAIEELTKIAPNAVDAIGEWLVRPHTSSVEDRRAVLKEISASVPDKSGKFATPPRQEGKERKADDEVDWLPKLLDLDPSMPGVGEVIADDAAIRALSATKDIQAAYPIFEAAFADETMIYRDECGRYLRKMDPYSIPALTKMSQRSGDRRRYGNYQLERIDRQEPGKALASAGGDEALTIAILDTYRETRLREAVHAVWTMVNDGRPRVRAAARAAWKDYITGPPPPPAPKKKLQLPGGKLTKKEKPLYLTYRELADNELRLSANELLKEDYPLEDPSSLGDDERPTNTVKIDLVEVTDRLYAFYDAERAKIDGEQWAQAKGKADAGDLPGATQLLDRLLAQNPQRAQTAEMAKIYFAYAKQLADGKKWDEAAAAYSKSHGLDPKGAQATEALAAHHYTLGKALEAAGKDGGPDYRKAVALKPDYAPAQAAAERTSPSQRPTWMLYAGVIAGAFAALLFGAGLMRRRRA
jgi:tetratricopeptide (TPR) repeat protein